MYERIRKDYDPAMEMLNEISDIPEGAELLKKLNAKKLEVEYEKSRAEN
jgi:hypothetical protein